MKQTAVEWLISKLNKEGFAQVVTDEEIQQAKAMEKEQIQTAYVTGYLEDIQNPSASHYYEDMGEQYYNETFKSE